MKEKIKQHSLIWSFIIISFLCAIHTNAFCQKTEADELYSKALNASNKGKDKKATSYYLKAAKLGHLEAQFKTGYRYMNGYGVPKNDIEAAKWFRKAAERGNADAQFYLALQYRYGKGVKEDNNEAFKWYQKAAEQGDRVAQKSLTELIDILYTDREEAFRKGLELNNKKEHATAAAFFLSAAKKGHAKAQNSIGVYYQYGLGIKKDYNEADKWYKKAVDGNFETAKKNRDDLFDKWAITLVELQKENERLLSLLDKEQSSYKIDTYTKQIKRNQALLEKEIPIVQKYYALKLEASSQADFIPEYTGQDDVPTSKVEKKTFKLSAKQNHIEAQKKESSGKSNTTSKKGSVRKIKQKEYAASNEIREECLICFGNGKVICYMCNGVGYTMQYKVIGDRSYMASVICATCNGEKFLTCHGCEGKGYVNFRQANLKYLNIDDDIYNTNRNSIRSNNNQKTKSICTFCNGTGKNPLCTYPPQYTTKVKTLRYCDICKKTMEFHTHDACPSCNGTGHQ